MHLQTQGFVINEMYILEINEQHDCIVPSEATKRHYLWDKYKIRLRDKLSDEV